MKTHRQYDVALNPNDGKWYAIGYIGDNKYIPISEGLASREEAEQYASKYQRAERAAKLELLNTNL